MYRFNPSWHARILRGDSPDTSGQNEAALMNAQTSKEALQYYKDEVTRTQGQRDQTTDLADKQAQQNLDAGAFATERAKQAASDYDTTYKPVEQKLAADAQSYDTAERRTTAANAATADVDAAFSSTQAANQRALARAGIAPGSAKSQTLMQDAAIQASAQRAGAATAATRNVEQQGYARMADVANMGRNIQSSQATQQSLGTNAANSAVSNSTSALGAATSGAALMGQGYNTAIQGTTAAGNLYGQAAASQAQAGNGTVAAIGGIATAAAIAY